jgi:hypothetical protein
VNATEAIEIVRATGRPVIVGATPWFPPGRYDLGDIEITGFGNHLVFRAPGTTGLPVNLTGRPLGVQVIESWTDDELRRALLFWRDIVALGMRVDLPLEPATLQRSEALEVEAARRGWRETPKEPPPAPPVEHEAPEEIEPEEDGEAHEPPPDGWPEPCPRCMWALANRHIRAEAVRPLPPGALAPLEKRPKGKPCCHDCAAADNLMQVFLVRRDPLVVQAVCRALPDIEDPEAERSWGMMRTAVGNDRQEQLRLPGMPMGLVLLGYVRSSEAGDLDFQHRWASATGIEALGRFWGAE